MLFPAASSGPCLSCAPSACTSACDTCVLSIFLLLSLPRIRSWGKGDPRYPSGTSPTTLTWEAERISSYFVLPLLPYFSTPMSASIFSFSFRSYCKLGEGNLYWVGESVHYSPVSSQHLLLRKNLPTL